MAKSPDTTTTSEVHPLTGSSPPSGQVPAFEPVQLGLEASRLPQEAGGDFGSYHREILHLYERMQSDPTIEDDDAAEPLMARWAEIDEMAMANQPRTLADAIGALRYARREHHQFAIEADEREGRETDTGDRLIQHLLDGAIAVLSRDVQTDVATPVDQPSDVASHVCTFEEAAELDFMPMAGLTVPTKSEWLKLSETHLPFARNGVPRERQEQRGADCVPRFLG